MMDGKPFPIPESWTESSIGKVVIKAKQQNPRKTPDEVFHYVDVSSVSNESFKITCATPTLGSDAPSRARKAIETDDVLFATVRPTLKRIALVPPEFDGAIASTGYCVLRCDKAIAEPRFLYSFLITDHFNARMVGLERGASYPAVRDSDITASWLPLPPLPEQKKIAYILSIVQRAIETQERLIQTTTELKKALMHKLFTEGLHDEPQKQTEIGPVPESWEVVELNQLADLKNGYCFKSKDYVPESNTLNIRMSNIRPGAQFDLDYKPRYLPDLFAEAHKSFLLYDGDLIIAMTDMANDPKILGMPTIVRNTSAKKLLLNQRVGKLVPTDNNVANFEFLRFYLSRKPAQRYLISCAKKGVQVNIGKKDILSVPIAFPVPGEQNVIVQCLNSLDERIGAAERKIATLQDIFQTLLYELMTAKIRVSKILLSPTN